LLLFLITNFKKGIFLVVHDKKLPLKTRFCLALALYAWLTSPLSISNIYLGLLYPIPVNPFIDMIACLVGAVNLYLYFIGAVKSFSYNRYGFFKFSLCVIGAICTVPFVVFIENIAVIWGLFSDKHKFYIVQKKFQPVKGFQV
jgi:beta-1,4-mannosyltransferase